MRMALICYGSKRIDIKTAVIVNFCVMQLGVPGQTPSKSGPLRKASLFLFFLCSGKPLNLPFS